MADNYRIPGQNGPIVKRAVEVAPGILAEAVVLVDALGAVVTPADPASAAAMAAALGTAADAANTPTVIGLLKQVIIKLGDVQAAIG